MAIDPKHIQAQQNRVRMLQLVHKRFTTSEMVRRRTGWSERAVQRYAVRLEADGLLQRTRAYATTLQYSITPKGKQELL